jgi:hypothetical protein
LVGLRIVQDEEGPRGQVADTHPLCSEDAADQPHQVRDGQRVDQAEEIAHQQGPRTGSLSLEGHDARPSHPLAGGSTPHHHLENRVIQKVNGEGRRYEKQWQSVFLEIATHDEPDHQACQHPG